jgi:hypothetical protein
VPPTASAFAKIHHPKKRAFLRAFALTAGNATRAARVAGVDVSTPRHWRKTDPAFAELFEVAKEVAADVMEAEAARRATEGVLTPAGWYKGKPGGYVREMSDTLLIFLLKGARAEKYRERVEVTGKVAHLVARLDMARLPDPIIDRIAAGEPVEAVLADYVARGGTVPTLPPGRDVSPPSDGESGS